ncbi:hypothetical protein OMP43_17515 [Sphingomonas sp. CBMAI 2297]|uniref:head-tail joining protein n=1 Tax=Sphingomonas sp. CBMAI 2297 TaxID=2991720 RepID=UPI00245860EC|nr:hypothetical protein [Sphingomonas sp. CBMAI 2297]MDH4745827.1 hypothetical protein [Sphingomonas sp. CBMAI 2297]
MAIDWDTELLATIMAVFGEGKSNDPSSWPTFHPRGGAAFQLPDAVFDSAYRQVLDLGDGVTSTTYHPVLGVRDALFEQPGRRQPEQGDIITMSNGDKYAVSEPQADGHGHTLLILIEAA